MYLPRSDTPKTCDMNPALSIVPPMRKAVVIVPTYNERENVEKLVSAVEAATDQADILFVDDNSPDGTGRIVEDLGKKNPRVFGLHREKKQGLGRAYIAGFNWALERGYAFIMEMDADFSHNPQDIPRFLKAAEDADLVLGSRYVNGIRVINWPLGRLMLSKGAGVYVRTITGMPFSDPTGGFKCFRREVLTNIPLDLVHSNGYSFQIEMTHQAWMRGFKIADLPIVFEERHEGTSKMNSGIVREALWMVWKLLLRWQFRRKPRGVNPNSVCARKAEQP